ncbi:MAG: hypothetical protein ACREJ1_04565, partial [Candidatus Methylomirabilales bacterium]
MAVLPGFPRLAAVPLRSRRSDDASTIVTVGTVLPGRTRNGRGGPGLALGARRSGQGAADEVRQLDVTVLVVDLDVLAGAGVGVV